MRVSNEFLKQMGSWNQKKDIKQSPIYKLLEWRQRISNMYKNQNSIEDKENTIDVYV